MRSASRHPAQHLDRTSALLAGIAGTGFHSHLLLSRQPPPCWKAAEAAAAAAASASLHHVGKLRGLLPLLLHLLHCHCCCICICFTAAASASASLPLLPLLPLLLNLRGSSLDGSSLEDHDAAAAAAVPPAHFFLFFSQKQQPFTPVVLQDRLRLGHPSWSRRVQRARGRHGGIGSSSRTSDMMQ